MRRGRVAVGLVLVAIAVGVPAVAGWVIGLADARSEARALRDLPATTARNAAQRAAQRIALRLGELATRESQRPYFHWQPLIVDPRGAYDGDAVVPSPLGDAPSDPALVGYFQIDQRGLVTSPEVNEAAGARPASGDALARLERFRAALAGRVAEPDPALAFVDRPPSTSIPNTPNTPNAPGPSPQPPGSNAAELPAEEPLQVGEPGPNAAEAPAEEPLQVAQAGPDNNVQVQRLSNAFYQQNIDANRIYEQIQTKRPQKIEPAPVGLVSVRLGPFAWETLSLGPPAAPSLLAATRSVATPDGALVQAFVVDPHKVAATLFDDPTTGSVRPQREPVPNEAVAPLPLTVKGRPWEVAIALGPEVAATEAQAERVVSDFVLRASLITLVVGLAALAIILSMVSAERTIARRQQFAAAAAHELRTPLAGLRMYAEMLAEGLGRPEKQRAYAERLSSEAARLGRVVTNVLDFARLERQTLAVKPAAGDLAAAVQDLVRRLEPAVQAHGATLVIDRSGMRDADLPLDPSGTRAADRPLMACFDPDALAQIVGNLVDNAEKYTRDSADRRIEVLLRETDRGPEVAVRDHGPGLPESLRTGRFRAFRRGTSKDGPAGLGLGLALTRALARAQGGELRVAPPGPSPRPGAELIVTFPRP